MELQFPQPLPQRDRGQNREPEPAMDAVEEDAGDDGEGISAPGFAHGIG